MGTAVALLMVGIIIGAVTLALAMRATGAIRGMGDAHDVWTDTDVRARILRDARRHRWED